ncbi:MAG: hypothetical protein LBS39_02840 [Campylobacteraceae bacterium]|jgi:hypothetical protein|nr:hypothetical protein [Campylobacteraceae bacterium]
MGLELYVSSGALTICIFVAIFVVYHKNSVTKRVIALENVIDDLNHQNHKLSKALKEIVDEKVEPLAKSLKEIKKITVEYRGQRLNADTIDFENKILRLYKDGKNESEIANMLGVSVKQVELILMLNNPQC